MLASILQEAGYKVGLYTSPHLKDFRERIRMNGHVIPEQSVVDFIDKHKTFFEANQLSFFEMTVGMAFDYFASEEVDIAVVEVGLGGRLDSTNILMPEVSVITNIGYDHMEFLGETLPEIAAEKAGIIKKGVPVIIGERQEETTAVFHEIAASRNAPLYFTDDFEIPSYQTDLTGSYQSKNMHTAIAVIMQLQAVGWEIDQGDIEQGLMSVSLNTGLKGRWQVLSQDPKVICDTAHNAEGLTLVLRQLEHESYDRLHMVVGMVSEKKLDKILPLFPRDAVYYFCKPDIPRGLDANILHENALRYGLKGKVYKSVRTAFDEAVKMSGNADLIFVGGSTFTVAEVL